MELQIIQNKIYELRGERVMLDYDLAQLYEIETKRLKEAVRRNVDRFPSDFMFELSKEELADLKSQNVNDSKSANCLRMQFASSNSLLEVSELENGDLNLLINAQLLSKGRGGIRYHPFAFTEQGVAMLARVLNSSKAIEVNISIVRAFVALRRYAVDYADLNLKLEKFMSDTNLQIDDIYQVLKELTNRKKPEQKPRNPVGYLYPNKKP